ncbi:hypothetical protein RFI_32380, partial [Reticulomyxa filosa]
MDMCCIFNGKIKEHLDESCPLRPLKCRFKEFGRNDILFQSNFEQHLQLKMERHLDLLLSYIGELRKELEYHQTCQEQIEKLRLEKKEQATQIRTLRKKNGKDGFSLITLLKVLK